MADHTIPAKGAWVIIKRRLPTLIQVPLFSIFYAMPDRIFPKGWHDAPFWSEHHQLDHKDLAPLWRWRGGNRNLLPNEVESVEKLDKQGVDLDQRVRILTPDGTVCVEPYEWVPCSDIKKFLDLVGQGVIMHEFGTAAKSGPFTDRLFYMQTRGIPKVEAMQLLFGEVRRQDTFWLEMEPWVVSFFDREAA